jgi:polysaccharide deacetylase family protein (PEP-CTERM system associated)
MNATDAKYFLITIDVEDWFQVENFKPWIPFETWGRRELRIERNVHRLLDMFDTISLAPSPAGSIKSANALNSAKQSNTFRPKATFFVLGWVAEKLPHLVREIVARGHEVASHGCYHVMLKKMSAAALRKDLSESRKRLEDTTGNSIRGFRAPSFSIDNDIIDIIAESGYFYDSSFNSFSLHGRYGKISLNEHAKIGIAHRMSDCFYELPISNLNFKDRVLPLGGGSYFRLIPYGVFRWGVKSILRNDCVYLFYLHPWEIDPEQPKVTAAPLKYQFRHYTNLKSTYKKLKRLISDFRSSHFITCDQFIGDLESKFHDESRKNMN